METKTCGGCYWTTGNITHDESGHRKRYCEKKEAGIGMHDQACEEFREDQGEKKEETVKREAQEQKAEQKEEARFRKTLCWKCAATIAAYILATAAVATLIVSLIKRFN